MPHYLEFEVTLEGATPRVWRRFQVHAGAYFVDLHRAIQDACGWEDYHLYAFQDDAGTVIAGVPDDEFDRPDPDASAVKLSAFFERVGQSCRYVYDFGDDWLHDVVLVDRGDTRQRFHRRLIDGARAFPPEDCGGMPGYEECVVVAQGGQDPGEMRAWLGDWDPERFELSPARAAFDL